MIKVTQSANIQPTDELCPPQEQAARNSAQRFVNPAACLKEAASFNRNVTVTSITSSSHTHEEHHVGESSRVTAN